MVDVFNPNAFNGILGSEVVGFGLRLPATAGNPLTLNGLSVRQHVDVEVPTAGTEATIGAIYDSGTLRKYGAGDLVVNGTAGAGTQIHVRNGSLTLGGHESAATDAGDDVPVAGAWLHLDANRADTIKSYVDPDDGRTYVTNWCDVRNNGEYAYFKAFTRATNNLYHVPSLHAPYVKAGAVCGKPVIDFGRTDPKQTPEWGPTNCALCLSKDNKQVYEVFTAGCVKNSGDATVIFGNYSQDSTAYPFHPYGNNIASPTYGHPGIVHGNIIVNGRPTGNEGPWPTIDTFGVVSVGSPTPFRLGAFGTDRHYLGRVGGIQIGEVLIFTNQLTQVERTAVHRYLQHKWSAGMLSESQCDFGAVTLNSSANTISVPEGRTAMVQELNAADGTLVKAGAGTLQIGSLQTSKRNAETAVEVAGGSVKFGGLETVSTAAPAANPMLWLKAERNTMVISNKVGDATDYVARWNDCRPEQTTCYAAIPIGHTDYLEGKLATLVTDSVLGAPAVDFGKYAGEKDTAGAFMNIKNGSGVYDAFVVHSYNESGAASVIFGLTAGTQLYNGGSDRFTTDLYTELYGGPIGRNALWTFNGAVVDAGAKGQALRKPNEWNVIGYSSQDKLDNMTYVGGKDRDKANSGAWGGCRIVELIYYSRHLSPAERRQTEAYLMKKWRNLTPFGDGNGVKVSKISFGADAPTVIDTDTKLTIDEIETSSVEFTKRGAGELVYGKSLTEDLGVNALSVEGGKLTYDATPLKAIYAKAAIHYDATDLSKMEYFVTEDLDGSSRTNLVKVYDQNNATAYMKAAWNTNNVSASPSFTNPTLKVVQTVEGIKRPVFDCGRYNSQGQSYATASRDAGYFTLSNAKTTIREAHTIYADTLNADGSNATGMDIFADTGYSLDYFRGGSGKLLNASYDSYIKTARAGDMAVDGFRMTGEEATQYILPRGFHLVSAFPAPSTKSAEGRVTIAAIGNTHQCGVGGCQVGELIAFTEPLTAAESTFLQNTLMAKWLGKPAAAWTNAFDTINVSAGATLDADGALFAVGALRGGGTINADRVAVSSTLALNTSSPLTINGTFEQVDEIFGTITAGALGEGIYPILTATAFEGLDLTKWNMTLPSIPKRTTKLVRSGNSVAVKVGRIGLIMLVQ